MTNSRISDTHLAQAPEDQLQGTTIDQTMPVHPVDIDSAQLDTTLTKMRMPALNLFDNSAVGETASNEASA